MRIQHTMISQPSWRILAVKVRGMREGKGGKEREQKHDRANAKNRNNSSIDLKLSSFRYHRNHFQNFSTKLQINAAKNTCDQTSSDKAPFNYILKIILNKKSKICNTYELLDAFQNKVSTESNMCCFVNMFCLIQNID